MWVTVCHYGCSGNALTLCVLLAEPPAVSSVCWEVFCKVFHGSVSHVVDSCVEFQLLQICCWFSCTIFDTCCHTNRFFLSTWRHNEMIQMLTLPKLERFHSRPLLESTWIFKWSETAACWSFKAKPAPAALQLGVLIEFTNRKTAHFTRILACNQQRPFPRNTEFRTYWREDSCILHGKKDKEPIDSLLAGWKPRLLQ